MRLPIICDCDNTMGVPGKPVDDGQTLLYLLGRPDIELLGVTTSFGNGTIDEVYGATTRLLRSAGRPDIPVLRGASRRGQLGTEAARFLAETVAMRPGAISLLAIGPQGNLRAAADLDPGFFGNLAQIACMGGYLGRLDVPGWEHIGEVNLSADPEAAFAALHAPCPYTLMNAQTCLQAPFGQPELERMQSGDPAFYAMLRDFLLFCANLGMPTEYLWDLLPAVYLSHPDLFDINNVWVRSSAGDLAAGAIVLGEERQGVRINMPSRILDTERFYAALYEAWGRARLA
jgi:inosine-uridine nucleoside N-ribohydrolase